MLEPQDLDTTPKPTDGGEQEEQKASGPAIQDIDKIPDIPDVHMNEINSDDDQLIDRSATSAQS